MAARKEPRRKPSRPIPADEYEEVLINSWARADEGEQFAALVRLQYNPRAQAVMQAAIEKGRSDRRAGSLEDRVNARIDATAEAVKNLAPRRRTA